MKKSIKNLVKISLAFVFLQCLFAACVYAQTVDLSTDEAVRVQLGKAKNKEFSGESRVCIKRLKESTNIIVIGFFRFDAGCHFDGAFVNAVYFEDDNAALSKNALAALGWKKAKRIQREKLAKLWIEKGLLAFYTVLYTKDEDFSVPRVTYKGGCPPKPREFHPPRVVSTKNGETVVTLWTSVVREEKEFHEHEFRFSSVGNLLED